MGLFNFLASFADTLRTAVYGPDHSATFPGQTDEGDRAWREFQERSRAAEAAAIATQEIGRIRRERRDRVHGALAGGRK